MDFVSQVKLLVEDLQGASLDMMAPQLIVDEPDVAEMWSETTAEARACALPTTPLPGAAGALARAAASDGGRFSLPAAIALFQHAEPPVHGCRTTPPF